MSKAIPPGFEKCEECEGSGMAVYSCCGDGVIIGDYPICPSCLEHLGEEECEACSGDGYLPIGTATADKVDLSYKVDCLHESLNQ